jgi:DNA-binding GntR family transcriptional regulator
MLGAVPDSSRSRGLYTGTVASFALRTAAASATMSGQLQTVGGAAVRANLRMRARQDHSKRTVPSMKMNSRAGTRRSAPKQPRGDRVTQAYSRLRELIVWGRLAPGTRIIETDVATRLGVSRTPVRGALQRLQQEGYIVSSGTGQQSRLSVAPLTKEDAHELFGIVSNLEALAARWAAGRDEPTRAALVKELNALNDELHAVANDPKPDHQRLFEVDQRFHRAYVEAGSGPRLLALHDAVKPQSERYIRLYISALVDEIDTSVDEHAGVIRAIAEGDPEAADEAVMFNWRNAVERLSRVIEALGERGTW